MLTEPQKLWVSALRSGEYEQGQGALCDDDRYCCLGVACALFIKHVDPDFPCRQSSSEIYFGDRCDILPREVQDWLQMRTADGVLQEDSLTSRNDDGLTFGEIADIIESESDDLFFNPQEETHAD